ncbi:MAG: hypothetical protein H0T60_15465 [Acidobacteria bacterium]|nr:hypothetical protein [Acidobacteriota bacterium]
MKTLSRRTNSIALALSLSAHTFSFAQQSPPPCPFAGTPTKSPDCHPYPQPRPMATPVPSPVGNVINIETIESVFPKPEVDPFTLPPGTNFLPTIYTNMFDSEGREMLNTLPSTPTNPYNLHNGDPVVTEINPTSPTDDLRSIFEQVTRLAGQPRREPAETEAVNRSIQRGIDILEGNPLPDRAYSGIPVLHYVGPDKVKPVTPIYDDTGKTVVGGNVNVHQVWYDSHIESDTAFVDPSAVMNVPWTVTFTVDVLNRGEDDFSPFVMYWDPPPPSLAQGTPKPMPKPHVGMDQSFFPMENGTRTVFKIKMAQGKYLNLTYTWGWRVHPPRAQVFENANKMVSANGGKPMSLPDWERSVFCPQNQPGVVIPCSPRSSEALKLRAISMIGDLAPEKQMWKALRDARDAARRGNYTIVLGRVRDAYGSFDDWGNRTRLPRAGKYRVTADKESDLTLLYVNNTIYAEFSDRSEFIDDAQRIDFARWKMRGTQLKVTIYNGDNFEHGYQNVDFGGARGWENQFKSSVKVGGSGCWFTFGRAHWWMNIPNTANGDLAVVVPAANKAPYKPSMRKVNITFNYEPSRRLRFYQFDPMHHDVAILSIH